MKLFMTALTAVALLSQPAVDTGHPFQADGFRLVRRR